MLNAFAGMIGLLQGNMGSGNAQSTSRGWWRLTASLFAIVGATIAFGYYLPLRQANQLLELEFAKARRSETALSQQLNAVRVELTAATEERDTLREAKAKSDTAAQDAQAKLQRLMEGLPPAARSAAQSGRMKLTTSAASLTLDVLDKTWVTPSSDALTRNGHRVICPALSALARERVSVTVRTFVSPEATTSESRWAAPGRLAAGVAETLIARCKLDAASVKVATSGAGAADAPLVQFELQLPAQ